MKARLNLLFALMVSVTSVFTIWALRDAGLIGPQNAAASALPSP